MWMNFTTILSGLPLLNNGVGTSLLSVSVPPKYAISEMMGFLKGKTTTKLLREQRELSKQYWGRHIWARGYCVSTIGLNEDQIRKYVKWQQDREQKG